MAVLTPGEAHNPPVHFYITYDAFAATMATMGDFEEISKIHLVRVVVDAWPWETMTQTSKTKSVTISLLKHLIGGPLGTTTTLVDHWFMSEASLPPIKTAFVSLTDMFGGVVIKANVTNFK